MCVRAHPCPRPLTCHFYFCHTSGERQLCGLIKAHVREETPRPRTRVAWVRVCVCLSVGAPRWLSFDPFPSSLSRTLERVFPWSNSIRLALYVCDPRAHLSVAVALTGTLPPSRSKQTKDANTRASLPHARHLYPGKIP